MSLATTYTQYIKWLTQSYKYYFLDDADMPDHEWDYWSRTFYSMKGECPPGVFPVLHMEEFTGASLFWLKKEEYPEEAIKAAYN